MMHEHYFRKVYGGYLFFPHGPFGRSYRVTESKKDELTALMDDSFMFSLSGTAALLVLPLLFFRLRRILKECPRSTEQQTFAEMQSAMARTMPRWFLYLILACGLLCVGGGLHLGYLSYFGENWTNVALGIAVVLFASVCIFNVVGALTRKAAAKP